MLSVRRVLEDLRIFGFGNIRSVTGLLLTLALPIMFIVLFGAIFSGGGIVGGNFTFGSGRLTVYVQNQDTGQMGQVFVNSLNSTNTTNIILVDGSQDLSAYLSAHSASDGIIIPKAFSSDYQSETPVNVTIYSSPASQSSAVISGLVSSIINSFNLKRAGGTAVIGTSRLAATTSTVSYIDFLVPGLIGYSILVTPMFAMVNLCSQYKRDKIFKQLSLTPLTKSEWLLSKNLWYIFLTIISFFLMVAFGVYLFGAHFALSLSLLPFLLVGPFLFISLGMLVGTLANSVESASLIGNLVTFPMMFLSGTFFPVVAMPQYLQSFAHVLPLYYVIDGLMNVMIFSNTSAAMVDVGILAAASAVIFGLAVRFFKWRED